MYYILLVHNKTENPSGLHLNMQKICRGFTTLEFNFNISTQSNNYTAVKNRQNSFSAV